MTEPEREPDIHERIIFLLDHLESPRLRRSRHPEDTATVKELATLVRLLITENSAQKEEIRKLHEKQTKINEILKARLGLDL